MIVFLVGNTPWKCWKWHLLDYQFLNFLRGWSGGGVPTIFISHLNWLVINSTVLFKKWDLLEFLWGKAIFGNVKMLNSFCFRGRYPLDPKQGSAPVPRWGPGRPQTPHLWGGLRLLSKYPHLLQILLTALCHNSTNVFIHERDTKSKGKKVNLMKVSRIYHQGIRILFCGC